MRLNLYSTTERRVSASFRRRIAIAVLLIVPGAAHAFGFEDVVKQARELAAKPYVKPSSNLPKEIKELNYDQYRNIRFKPEKSYWHSAKLPFELTFLHQGSVYEYPVKINEVSKQGIQPIRFDPALFEYDALKIDPKKLRNLNFAGFRVHHALNSTKYKDEVQVFLGASYFRAVGKGQLYGLSSRGLAIDTALNSGEEFPQFVEFWIERPKDADKELTIYALLNSNRATGAYRFVLKPGTDTAVDVKARLFMRENVTKLGIAPLTSMFFFGENQRPVAEDYRPEVHDSDGLSIQSGTGEWIWRPLVNPKRLLVTSYALNNPLGFGLMQRDRQFSSYEDLEARYEMRPSAWVEPKGPWGSGRVELVQIPTPDETNDNIVAFWAPDTPPQPGQPFDIEYRLLWQKETEKRPPLSWVMQTRRSRGQSLKSEKPDESIALLIDFEGPALKKLAPDVKPDASITMDANGKLLETNTYRNEVTGGWRLAVRLLRTEKNKPVELRAFLRNGSNALSETWSYILTPD